MLGRRRGRMPWSSGTSNGPWSPGSVSLTWARQTPLPPSPTPSDLPPDESPTVPFARPPGGGQPRPPGRPRLFDWAAWRARTGGVDGRTAPAARGGPPYKATPGRWAGWNQRTAVVVTAVVAAGAVLGGLAAFASRLGGPAPTPAAAPSIAPGGLAGVVAGATGHGGPGQGAADPSLSPPGQPSPGQSAAGAGPAGHAAPHADPFSPVVTSYLAGRAGTALAAVYDVGTGQTWTLGTGRPQPTGSLVKVDILQTLLARQPGGLTPADRALARAMIENSSNDAATTLWRAVGQASGLRSYDASAGLRHTTPSTCLVCAGFGWPGWGLTTTTPADQLLLLRQLIDGPLLSAAARGYALSLMENVQPDQRWGVSTGPPAGVLVALKNAWVPLTPADADWQINSEGWVYGDGRDYLIAVLTTGNPDEQYGIDTIDTVSAMLWAAMAPGG